MTAVFRNPATPAAPPLDLQRALQVSAFTAWIDTTIGDAHRLTATRMLQKLVDGGLAQLSPCHETGAVTLTMFGIASRPTKADAPVILRFWQNAALDRLAGSPVIS